jgi:hypothetical protein
MNPERKIAKEKKGIKEEKQIINGIQKCAYCRILSASC